MNRLSDLDGIAQAALVASREATALELVDAAIARIEAVEPTVHALASEDFARARERAKTPVVGPLGGVPFLVKDLLPYPGQRCTFGARLFRDNVATAPLPYADALDATGLVTLGKSTTSELGLLGSTEALVAGTTRNPWDLATSAGGSSGGAAAAVASGMVPLAHASDGGGSIRIPAALNGLFGFMPSRSRCVPPGAQMIADLVRDHCVSRSVRDSALLAHLMTDPDCALRPMGHVTRPLDRALRIGFYSRTLVGEAPDAEIAEALARTATLCASLGHEVFEVAPPPIEGRVIGDAFFTLAGASIDGLVTQMAPMLGRSVGDEDLEPFTLAVVAWYRGLGEGALARAMEAVDVEGARMRAFLEGPDVVLCPTVPCGPLTLGTLAPTLDRETLMRRMERLAGYTPIHNIAGVPAMSVPLERAASGAPIGMHFTAAPGEDAMLLGLALSLEEAAPWIDRRAPHRAP